MNINSTFIFLPEEKLQENIIRKLSDIEAYSIVEESEEFSGLRLLGNEQLKEDIDNFLSCIYMKCLIFIT